MANQLDRIECAENYKQHITKSLSGDKTARVHGKRLNVGELAKDAYNHILNQMKLTIP